MADSSNPIADQPPSLTVAKPPSLCRLCNVELSGPQAFRAHLKSDEHIYNLQLKVAEPGTTPSPPSANAPKQQKKSPSHSRPRKPRVEPESDQQHESSADSDSDVDPDQSTPPEFTPSKCLFCSQQSSPPTLPSNLSHMSSAHGFTIPFQDCLAADITLETILEYLHFVIFAYRECISCSTRRGTVPGIQQHMIAKGHCRFDISPDTEDFYEMPQQSDLPQTESDSLRLPSGKLISTRKNPEPTRRSKPQGEDPDPVLAPAPPAPGFRAQRGTPSTSTDLIHQGTRAGGNEIVQRSEAILAAQLSRLRISGDRVQKKEEERKRGRLESANNTILRHHFRISAGDSRAGKSFC